MRVAVFGAGAWGTAIAVHMASAGHVVYLVPRSAEKAHSIRLARENTFYLKDIKLPDSILVEDDLSKIEACECIFLACPSKGLDELCKKLKAQLDFSKIKWAISLIKGLSKCDNKRPSEIFKRYLPNICFACLSGPTYALEVAQGKHAAMVLASENEAINELQVAISNEIIRVYGSKDLVGVELAGCLKNIYAIGAGIVDGLELGDNAKAAYLTRSLYEMCKLGVSLGGLQRTFYGLSGLGDLLATAQGDWSRNRTFGKKFTQGIPINELIENYTVEGFFTTKSFYELAKLNGLEAPILEGLYNVLHLNAPLKTSIQALMLRHLKDE